MGIFVYLEFDNDRQNRIRRLAGRDDVHFCRPGTSFEVVKETFLSSRIIFGNPPRHWLAQCRALQWLQLDSTGFGEYEALAWDHVENREQPVVCNLSGFYAEPVAETCLAGILSLMRGIDQCVDLKARRHWRGHAIRPGLRLLANAAVVFFGFGAINRRLAEILQPFGCRIRSFGRNWDAVALDRALEGADVVVCVAPHTSSTSGVFDRDRLARIPSSAILVNAGRGSLLDEAALAERLHAGDLAGAVIDVTATEPLPREHAFWSCPNLLLTQHSAGGCEDELDRKIDYFESNLHRFNSAEPVKGIVRLSRGY
ncbi:MAG: hypothetical protein OXF56_24095 [Rhodobacteraceae bacterium]|nr:hypothetical protein [Paracoccaceae bacterium]